MLDGKFFIKISTRDPSPTHTYHKLEKVKDILQVRKLKKNTVKENRGLLNNRTYRRG